jgi:hypothetical protein
MYNIMMLRLLRRILRRLEIFVFASEDPVLKEIVDPVGTGG